MSEKLEKQHSITCFKCGDAIASKDRWDARWKSVQITSYDFNAFWEFCPVCFGDGSRLLSPPSREEKILRNEDVVTQDEIRLIDEFAASEMEQAHKKFPKGFEI